MVTLSYGYRHILEGGLQKRVGLVVDVHAKAG